MNKKLPDFQDERDILFDKYMELPWFRHMKAKVEESTNIDRISRMNYYCAQSGELISESDGQFTGGYSTEVYRYAGDVYEFGYQNGKLENMTRFDGEMYE